MIPLCVPSLDRRDHKYVYEALWSGYVVDGPFIERLEHEFSRRMGGLHCVAVASGTAALHTAMLCIHAHAGEPVLVSDLTFIATANAVSYTGAYPIFADADPTYWQLDVDRVPLDYCPPDQAWNDVAVITDLLGHPADVAALRVKFDHRQITIIEDACEALGACYQGKPVGTTADIACFSFNANKIITGAGGGMLVTPHADHAERARYLIDQAKDDSEDGEFEHSEIGFNYRMTNIQAAIALSQFERLDEHLAAKRRIAKRYAEGLGDLPGVTLMPAAPWADPAYWLYTILIDGGSRPLIRALAAAGIESRPIFKPVHLQPPYAASKVIDGRTAERLWQNGISLPSSVGLTESDQDAVITAIRQFVGGGA